MVVHQVVVTGLGAITPFGVGVPSFWQGLLGNDHRFGSVAELAPKPLVGAQVPPFDSTQYLDQKVIRQSDRFVQMALIAAHEAMANADHPEHAVSPSRIGVLLGTAVGGLQNFRQATLQLEQGGRLSPFFVTSFIPNMAAARIAMAYGLHGANLTVSTACAAGTDAIGLAMDFIRSGRADIMLAGGAEALFIPEMVTGLFQTRALSPNPDPNQACRPFDANRSGMVMGEGSAVMVLESEESALKRGATPLARVIGYGTHNDGEHPAAPAADGHGQWMAMTACLRDAQIAPEQVDYVNAHGTATVLGDRTEWQSIADAIGAHVTVSSIKGHIGHLLGAAGAVEAVATIKMIQTGIIPTTLGCQIVDPECPLSIVQGGFHYHPMHIALSNSFGLGGQNATIALAAV